METSGVVIILVYSLCVCCSIMEKNANLQVSIKVQTLKTDTILRKWKISYSIMSRYFPNFKRAMFYKFWNRCINKSKNKPKLFFTLPENIYNDLETWTKLFHICFSRCREITMFTYFHSFCHIKLNYSFIMIMKNASLSNKLNETSKVSFY